MKKIKIVYFLLLFVALSIKSVNADEHDSLVDEARLSTYINVLYKHIDFRDTNRLSYEVFEKAYRGYLNLKNSGKLNNDKQILSICDLNLPSSINRLWVIDLSRRKVIFNTYVAHGMGSGEECAETFSNNFDSHQTSLGFYVTGETYCGDHGLSLRLNGMDPGFNDAAADRGIVVHGADYVSDKFIANNQRLGRSWGCPAVPDELKGQIIDAIKDGTCLFIYYPEKKYLTSSCWLNRRVSYLPESCMYPDLVLPEGKAKPRVRVYKYITNGKVDSVVTVPITE